MPPVSSEPRLWAVDEEAQEAQELGGAPSAQATGAGSQVWVSVASLCGKYISTSPALQTASLELLEEDVRVMTVSPLAVVSSAAWSSSSKHTSTPIESLDLKRNK